jgi:hypothetical protein
MRTVLAALLVLGTTACLRSSSTPDLDASSNGNSNGGGQDGGNPSGGQDGGTTGGNQDGGSMNMPDAGMQTPACKNKVTSYGSGHHNPGQNCMSSCHNHGFTLAGTLYSSATGGTAVAGASITVKDSTGAMFDIVTQSNGNFYTSQSVHFPVTVYASECQISQMSQVMTDSIATGQGGCSMTGCHTTSAQGRIHLP